MGRRLLRTKLGPALVSVLLASACSDARRDVRFPPTAGHRVSHKQGGEFAADVCHWMLNDCPLP